MSLPPDRGHLATELPPRDAPALDTLTTNDCIAMLAADQHAAVRAVEQVATDIAALVDAIAPRIAAGGRLIYLGCGTSGRLGVLDAAECPPTFQAEAGTIIGLIAGRESRAAIAAATVTPAAFINFLRFISNTSWFTRLFSLPSVDGANAKINAGF